MKVSKLFASIILFIFITIPILGIVGTKHYNDTGSVNLAGSNTRKIVKGLTYIQDSYVSARLEYCERIKLNRKWFKLTESGLRHKIDDTSIGLQSVLA